MLSSVYKKMKERNSDEFLGVRFKLDDENKIAIPIVSGDSPERDDICERLSSSVKGNPNSKDLLGFDLTITVIAKVGIVNFVEIYKVDEFKKIYRDKDHWKFFVKLFDDDAKSVESNVDAPKKHTGANFSKIKQSSKGFLD